MIQAIKIMLQSLKERYVDPQLWPVEPLLLEEPLLLGMRPRVGLLEKKGESLKLYLSLIESCFRCP